MHPTTKRTRKNEKKFEVILIFIELSIICLLSLLFKTKKLWSQRGEQNNSGSEENQNY